MYVRPVIGIVLEEHVVNLVNLDRLLLDQRCRTPGPALYAADVNTHTVGH